MGNVLTAIMSYRLYDNWSKNSVFLHKNTPEDAEYDKVLNGTRTLIHEPEFTLSFCYRFDFSLLRMY